MDRKINYIVIHCTATSQDTTKESIQRYWREELGWENPGYNFLIEPDGHVVELLPVDQIANGVRGYNNESIHLSYIGGVDDNGQPLDNRTPAQKESMASLVKVFSDIYPYAEIKGHRDFPNVQKACPSFDVAAWIKTIDL